ncbi:MAG: LysM peptidoglycan-binding domain-containing protein [Chloroflexi bacterium]|nr:MAG: LysM peptidoglycan-binding domain-containing protein [Chloroflexota bacterium]
MYNRDGFVEPPIDPLEDTHPTQTFRKVQTVSTWRRVLGWLSLLGTLAFTAATVFLLLNSNGDPETPPPTIDQQPTIAATFTPQPQPTQETVVTVESIDQQPEQLPTVNAEVIAGILNTPLEVIEEPEVITRIERNIAEPFTIIPDRPRNEVIQYTIERGDTIFTIAERFGLKPETIAWSNDRSIIQVLRPGRSLNILPVDGVYHQAVGSSNTIASIAAQYNIENPFTIIDSEFNPTLHGMQPDDVPPSGTRIVIPGGEAEQIAWNPGVNREGGDGGGNSSGGDFITFAPGQPGSCGRQPNTGGTFWTSPLPNGSWVRGFTPWHTGVDLAASPGTTVFAANGGRVIFAGWNNFGYGNTIVLTHGPFTTLYGHLSSINVRCGDVVVAGQPIGGVGSTGNSSGPHLHFEIRFLDQPTDPTATLPF